MLVQTAERKHAREVHEQDPTAWWPRDAIDQWWRACKKSDKRPEYVALDLLDRWKYSLNYGYHLLIPAFHHHLQQTGGSTVALPLDSISVAALCFYSSTHKLRAAQTSSLQVRRAGDNATSNLTFVGNLVDTAGISTHCTSNNGFCSIWRDGSANGQDIDNAVGQEPQIYTGATTTLKTLSNGKHGYDFNGSNQRLGKTTVLGLTGNPAITVAWTMQQSDPDSFCWSLGTGGAGTLLSCNFYTVGRFGCGTAGFREFTFASAITSPSRWVAAKAAGAAVGAYTLSQNGTALSQSGINSTNPTLNLGAGSWLVATALGDFCAMVCNSIGAFAAVLTGSDATALEDLQKLHVP